jgi:hypothetical protein
MPTARHIVVDSNHLILGVDLAHGGDAGSPGSRRSLSLPGASLCLLRPASNRRVGMANASVALLGLKRDFVGEKERGQSPTIYD